MLLLKSQKAQKAVREGAGPQLSWGGGRETGAEREGGREIEGVLGRLFRLVRAQTDGPGLVIFNKLGTGWLGWARRQKMPWQGADLSSAVRWPQGRASAVLVVSRSEVGCCVCVCVCVCLCPRSVRLRGPEEGRGAARGAGGGVVVRQARGAGAQGVGCGVGWGVGVLCRRALFVAVRAGTRLISWRRPRCFRAPRPWRASSWSRPSLRAQRQSARPLF